MNNRQLFPGMIWYLIISPERVCYIKDKKAFNLEKSCCCWSTTLDTSQGYAIRNMSMDNMVIHEISFSFDQPDQVLNALLKLLQQRLRQPVASKTSREVIVRNALTVLIVDMQKERAQYVGGLLTTAGYRTVIASTELEAFTSFLQGGFLPMAITLRSDDSPNRLFINRLRQQLVQKYDWEPLFIHLQDAPSTYLAPSSQHERHSQSLDLTHPSHNQSHSQKRESSDQWLFTNDFASSPISEANSGPLPVNPASRVPFTHTDATPRLAPTTDFSTFPPFLGPSPNEEQPIFQSEMKRDAPPEKIEPVKKEKVYLDGQSLGRYQIRARLGSSTYSEVYRTYDRLREQESALKAIQVDMIPFYMMKESAEEVTVFQQESDLLGALQHPHILPVLNCGKSYISGVNFIYKNMPFCAEGSLASWLRRNGGLGSFSLKDVLPVILQLADALQFAHNYQVTYQKFKLSNILVLNQGKRIQKLEVAFSDFSVIQDGSSFSKTPDDLPYIAPERWDNIVSPASDQYGFAAIVYELLTGRPPFQGTSEHVMKILHTTKSPQPPSALNPKLPPTMNAVFSTALAKKPMDRFGSVGLLAQTLQRC
jgi:CheY-like chemotaxis protein